MATTRAEIRRTPIANLTKVRAVPKVRWVRKGVPECPVRSDRKDP